MALNFEQQSVVDELSSNILLLASAGTGKTDTLSKRIVNIVRSEKANPDQILCITFTNKACREMKERIEYLLGGEAKDIVVKTFHSFCFDVVKEWSKKRTDLFSDFIIYDEDDCRSIIKQAANDTSFTDNYLRFIELIKLERTRRKFYSNDISIDYQNTVDTVFANYDKKVREICTTRGEFDFELYKNLKNNGKDIVLKYNSMLTENHGVDFNDLISRTDELFTDREVVEVMRKRFRYINIDEVQDTSTLEYSIIEKIFGDNNILMCGDIFQTIYSWRGSNPQTIFKEFIDNYSPRKIVFKKNYRATKCLTKASIDYLHNAFPAVSREFYEEGIEAESVLEGEKIQFHECESIMKEAQFIYDEIMKLISEGRDVSKTCVLTRDNNYNVQLSKNLKYIMNRQAVNFDFVLVDQFRFFRRQEIKDIIAFMKLMVNRYDSVSLRRITKRLPTHIGEGTLKDIESPKYRKAGILLSDFIDPLVIDGGEKFSTLVSEFQKDNVIVFDVESTGIDVTEDEIIQIAAIRFSRDGKEIDRFERFLKNNKSVESSEHVHGFSDEFLRINGEDRKKVLIEFKEYLKGAVVVGHNVQYDINILRSELSRLGLGEPEFKAFYDTLDIYRRFHPNIRNHKLQTLSEIFGTNHKPSHNAMDDIIATGELLILAIRDDIIPTSLERISLMGTHLKAFSTFGKKLNELFLECKDLRPNDVVAEIVKRFNLKSIYSENVKNPQIDSVVDKTSPSEKISRMRDFYVIAGELDDKGKSPRDALLDMVKITGLSNGDLENLIINRTKKTRIPIITVHQAKGLEFENVFLCGMQHGGFPSYMSIKSGDLNEEKRTFYVAITRAKRRLFISYSHRNAYGRYTPISEFIGLIPSIYVEKI